MVDRELASGERYIETILHQVGQADHFVLLLSEAAKDSTWIAFEVGAARAREFEQKRDFIKIAHIDNCEVPGFLSEGNQGTHYRLTEMKTQPCPKFLPPEFRPSRRGIGRKRRKSFSRKV